MCTVMHINLFAAQKLEELENELASDSRKPPSGRGDDVAAPAGARAVLGELPGTEQSLTQNTCWTVKHCK